MEICEESPYVHEATPDNSRSLRHWCFEVQLHSYDSMALDFWCVPMDAVKTTNESYLHFIEVEATKSTN